MIESEVWQSIERIQPLRPRIDERRDRRRKHQEKAFPDVKDDDEDDTKPGERGEAPNKTEEPPRLPRKDGDPEHNIDLVVASHTEAGRTFPTRQFLPGRSVRVMLH